MSIFINQNGYGILQQLPAIETTIIQKADTLLTTWRTKSFDRKQALEFYRGIDDSVPEEYRHRLGKSWD